MGSSSFGMTAKEQSNLLKWRIRGAGRESRKAADTLSADTLLALVVE